MGATDVHNCLQYKLIVKLFCTLVHGPGRKIGEWSKKSIHREDRESARSHNRNGDIMLRVVLCCEN